MTVVVVVVVDYDDGAHVYWLVVVHFSSYSHVVVDDDDSYSSVYSTRIALQCQYVSYYAHLSVASHDDAVCCYDDDDGGDGDERKQLQQRMKITWGHVENHSCFLKLSTLMMMTMT